jgi:hypothetical protein
MSSTRRGAKPRIGALFLEPNVVSEVVVRPAHYVHVCHGWRRPAVDETDATGEACSLRRWVGHDAHTIAEADGWLSHDGIISCRAITALVSGGHRNTTSMMSRVDVGGRCGAGVEVER